MNHRQAVEYLPDLGSSFIEPSVARELDSHMTRCSACKEWVATYKLLLHGLATLPDPDEGDHPETALLALCAIRPDEVFEAGREDVRQHLSSCTTCRKDVNLLTCAVRNARPAPREPGTLGREKGPKRQRLKSYRQVGAAASLGACGVLVLLWLLSHGTVTQPQPRIASRVPLATEPIEELVNHHFRGVHRIEASRRLAVSKVKIEKGAEVAFHAGETVAFGDGFQVAAGARLEVSSSR